jgi:hypothetical protein
MFFFVLRCYRFLFRAANVISRFRAVGVARRLLAVSIERLVCKAGLVHIARC